MSNIEYLDSEVVRLPIRRYRDPDEQPTCAAHFETGDVCIFYRTCHFGTAELCALDTTDSRLCRRDDDRGSLIPSDGCLVWVRQ